MTKNEILQQIEELKQQVLQMEEEEQEFPKKGDEHFCILAHGEIHEEVWMDDFMDLGRFSIGNCFKTKEKAEFYVEKLKVIAELKRFSRPFEYGVDNWTFLYDLSDKKMRFNPCYFFQVRGLFFESEEKAREAIEAVGEERIKKYYLEVEE